MSIENDSGRDCGLNRRRMEHIAAGVVGCSPLAIADHIIVAVDNPHAGLVEVDDEGVLIIGESFLHLGSSHLRISGISSIDLLIQILNGEGYVLLVLDLIERLLG